MLYPILPSSIFPFLFSHIVDRQIPICSFSFFRQINISGLSVKAILFPKNLMMTSCRGWNSPVFPVTCGCSGACIRYGSYRRHVKTDGRKLTLQIQRVLCQNCGRSHALLPSALVPYSQSRIITAVFSE